MAHEIAERQMILIAERQIIFLPNSNMTQSGILHEVLDRRREIDQSNPSSHEEEINLFHPISRADSSRQDEGPFR